MATLYWGGGSGTWNGTSTTNWYTDLARTIPAAAAPTYTDDVVFDATSNATSYTVTTNVAALFTASISGTTMTVSSVTSGTLAVGQTILPLTNTLPSGVTITALGTGTGGTGTYTLSSSFTIGSTGYASNPAVCQNITVAGPATGTVSFTTAANYCNLYVSGSLTFPATGMAFSAFNGTIYFKATTTGKTITTNGVSMTSSSVAGFIFDGIGGGWTLGSAWTHTGTSTNVLYNGSFDTGNYNVTIQQFTSSNTNTRSITLGSSTIALAGNWDCTTSTNLTLNAGTSTINQTRSGSVTFQGGGLTYYDYIGGVGGGGGGTNIYGNNTFRNFSHTAYGRTLNFGGSNTFTNLTLTSSPSAWVHFVTFGADQTITGTLTFGTANTAIIRTMFSSSLAGGTAAIIGVQRTLTVAAVAGNNDVDFRDIKIAGAVGTLTGTRFGDCGNNSNITFPAPKTVYWNLAGAQNWSATAWATTNTGVPALNNFPLAQDTATFTEAGAAGTINIVSVGNVGYNVGAIQMADGVSNRTTAFTWAWAANGYLQVYKDITLFSNLINTAATSSFLYLYGQNVTQNITTAGATVAPFLTIANPGGTVKLLDNFTGSNATPSVFLSAAGLTSTLDLNSKTLTLSGFQAADTTGSSGFRVINFGTGNITATGNNTTVFSANSANVSYTGTPVVNCTYSGATGTRTITMGSAAPYISLNISAGTDTVAVLTRWRCINLNFTGFSGTLTNGPIDITGNLTFSAGMTVGAGTNSLSFLSTSGTQQVTNNGRTLDFPIIVNTPGAIVQMQDALTMGSTRPLNLTAGTLQLKAGTTNTVGSMTTSGTTAKYLQSTLAGTQATLTDSSGTNSLSYTTISDSNATGGATWLAYTTSGNIDGGNTTGWDFGATPVYDTEITYRLRSFTQQRRF